MDIPKETLRAEEALRTAEMERRRGRGARALSRALRGGPSARQVGAAAMAVAAPAAALHTVPAAFAAPSAPVSPGIGSAGSRLLVTDAHAQAVQAVRTVLTAARAKHGISDAEWRRALLHAAAHVINSGVSRSGLWQWVGEGNNGPQCAIGQALIIHIAENALHLPVWVSNPRVTPAYGEPAKWKIWRVENDGSFTQWAQNHGRWHPGDIVNGHTPDGYRVQPGDLGSYGGHIVMLEPHPDGTMWYYGVDDSSDLGDHHAIAPGGFVGVIDMSLPNSLQGTAPAAPAQPAPPAQSAAPAQDAALQQAALGGMALPGTADVGNGRSGDAVPLTVAAGDLGGMADPGVVTTTAPEPGHHGSSGRPAHRGNPAPRRRPAPAPGHQNGIPAMPALRNLTAYQRHFIEQIWWEAVLVQHETGVPASVTVAQAIDETGWGNSVLATTYNNWFGMKALKGYRSTPPIVSNEVINGQTVPQSSRFAWFDSVAQGVRAHGHHIATFRHQDGTLWYAAAMAHASRTPSVAQARAFGDALSGVYASDPGYGAKLQQLEDKYGLYALNVVSVNGHAAQAPGHAGPGGHAGSGTSGKGNAPGPAAPAPVPSGTTGSMAEPGSPQGTSAPVASSAPPAEAVGSMAEPGSVSPPVGVPGNGDHRGRGQPGRGVPPSVRKPMPWNSASGAGRGQGGPPQRAASPGPAPRSPRPPATARPNGRPQAASSRPARIHAELTAMVEPSGQVTRLSSMGYRPSSQDAWLFSTRLYGQVAKHLSVLQQVSAMTGLPVEIVATLLLSTVAKPKVAELVTVSEKFIRRAGLEGTDMTRLGLLGVRDAFDRFGESQPVRGIPAPELALTMATSERL